MPLLIPYATFLPGAALLMVPVDSDSDSVIESRLPPFSQHPLSSARHTTFLSDMGEHWAGAHLSEGERHPELNTRRLASCSTSWGSMCRRPLLACPLGCHSCPYSSTVLTPLSTAPPSTHSVSAPLPLELTVGSHPRPGPPHHHIFPQRLVFLSLLPRAWSETHKHPHLPWWLT